MSSSRAGPAGGCCRRGWRDLAATEVQRGGLKARETRKKTTMDFLLWIIAVILVVAGVATILRGRVLYGAVLIVVGLLVGPGGVSIFT
jgi:hypothetical protein